MAEKAAEILIAEDDFTSRIMLESILQKFGFRVIPVCNGVEAIEEMEKDSAPEIAILDWMMPEMDGLEVIRRIREKESPTPPYLIVLTAKSEKSDIIKALGSGADDYLVKPFDSGELKARINVGYRMTSIQKRLSNKITQLKEAAEHIKTLQGILPICSFCKKVRNDKGFWKQVDDYISSHSELRFSHGVCPECRSKHYSQEAQDETDGD